VLAPGEGVNLKHLGVLPNDKPGTDGQRWKAQDGEQTKADDESRHRDEDDNHPSSQLETELGSRAVQRLVDG